MRVIWVLTRRHFACRPGAPAGCLPALDDHDRHGEMGYMARPDRVERRQDPQIILPGLQSIISVGLTYSTHRSRRISPTIQAGDEFPIMPGVLITMM